MEDTREVRGDVGFMEGGPSRERNGQGAGERTELRASFEAKQADAWPNSSG